MEKQLLKQQIINMNLQKVKPSKIKYKFDYDKNYDLMVDMISLINDELDCFNDVDFVAINYILKTIKCLSRLIDVTDVSDIQIRDNLHSNLSAISTKISSILDNNVMKDNQELVLYKIKSKTDKMIFHINQKNPNTINIEEDRAIETSKNDKRLIYYIIFGIKDITRLKEALDKYPSFIETIKENSQDIINELVDDYLNDLLYGDIKEANYYYEVIALLNNDKYTFFNANKSIIKLSLALDTLSELDIDDTVKQEIGKEINSLIKICDSEDRTVEAKYGLNINYNHSIVEEIKKIKSPQYDNVIDLTDKNVFTIDGERTICFDDAVSVELLPNNNYLVGVYIADVNGLIKPETNIDKYALGVGQTIYGKNTVPMLPEIISLDKASLNSKGPKNVYAYLYEITPDYEIVDFKACNAVIKVKVKFTYEEADNLINKGYNYGLIFLYELAQYLDEHNLRRKEYLKYKSHVEPEKKKNSKYKDDCSAKIISQLKILTNSILASEAYNNKCPFIYRDNLKREIIVPNDIIKLSLFDYKSISGLLNTEFMSSYYSATNKGHYGLNLPAYAHATTPLRNYSSVYNQRIIQKLLIDKNLTDKELYDLEICTPYIANYLNKRIALNDLYSEEMSIKKAKVLTKK